MIALIIDNSTSQIAGLDIFLHKRLKDVLSYRVSSASVYFGNPAFNKRSLLDKRGFFPTGLLYLVENFIKKENLKISMIKDNRKRPESVIGRFSIKLGHTPYPEQLAAAKAIYDRHRGIISAPTGSGKSLIAALIINQLQVRTLVVVPTLELKKQLTKSLEAAFGEDKVGSIRENRDIAVENVDALEPKKEITSYDCVIIDEFHHSGAKTYRMLNKKAWKNIYYRCGLTATPFRSQENERLLLESVLSKIIYRIEYQSAVKKGYIVPIEAYYFDLPKISVEGYTWSEVYSELVVNREDRNELIAKLLNNLNEKGVSTIALVKEIGHGLKIQENLNFDCPYVKGENDDNREQILTFNLKTSLCLLGTNGILGEGIDTKPAEFVIVAGLGKSKNQFMQQCGRGIRVYPGKESCKVILFRDASHKWTLSHFKAQCKYLRDEYGIKPVKLEIP